MANDCEEEKSYVSLNPRFVKKLSLTTVRIHDTLSFFFEQVYGVFGGGGKGKPSIFMGVEEERLDCETLAYLCDN